MSRFIPGFRTTAATVAAISLTLAACSEPASGPREFSPHDPSFDVSPIAEHGHVMPIRGELNSEPGNAARPGGGGGGTGSRAPRASATRRWSRCSRAASIPARSRTTRARCTRSSRRAL